MCQPHDTFTILPLCYAMYQYPGPVEYCLSVCLHYEELVFIVVLYGMLGLMHRQEEVINESDTLGTSKTVVMLMPE